MEVKDLRFFVAVYEARNFAQASAALHTVQSNVSAHIRKLEEFLGEALFERHRRGAVPTEKGERLYRYAKTVIALVDEAADSVRGRKTSSIKPDKAAVAPSIR
jgi:DNA-binding transcriptional LysR family regulator